MDIISWDLSDIFFWDFSPLFDVLVAFFSSNSSTLLSFNLGNLGTLNLGQLNPFYLVNEQKDQQQVFRNFWTTGVTEIKI